MNVHEPERQPGESFEGYQERRRLSRLYAKKCRVLDFKTHEPTGELVVISGPKPPSSRAELRANQRRNRHAIALRNAKDQRTFWRRVELGLERGPLLEG